MTELVPSLHRCRIFRTFAGRMKQRTFILLFCLLSLPGLQAQSAADADRLFRQADYPAAGALYARLAARQPSNALYQYRYARCLQEQGDHAEAIRHFELAGSRYALRDFFLGRLYAEAYRFTEAAAAWERYIEAAGEEGDRYEDALAGLQYARKGERFIRRVADLEITDSVLLPKTDFLKAYTLSSDAGSLRQEREGVVYTNQLGRRRIYSIGPDTLRMLVQTYGTAEGGETDTLPLPVNTSAAEDYPFQLSDGLTLFFASTRSDGLGGYDLYQTRYNAETDTWLAPENLGFPFNSPADDYMLAIDESRSLAWFATDRRTAPDSVCIYSFRYTAEPRLLRDVDEEYIRRAAQLTAFRTPDVGSDSAVVPVSANEPVLSSGEESPSSPAEQQEAPAFRFVVCDTLVYTALSDFRSPDARQSFAHWQQLTAEVAEEQASLDAYRLRYAGADAEQRRQLAPVILTAETTLRTLRSDAALMLAAIRRQELSALSRR